MDRDSILAVLPTKTMRKKKMLLKIIYIFLLVIHRSSLLNIMHMYDVEVISTTIEREKTQF